MEKDNEIGIVEPKVIRVCDEMTLVSGSILGPIDIAYETYGELNEKKNNAILITHAFSGDAHAAGFFKGAKKPGWWHKMIGPKRAFDTEQYFIICSNVIGGCSGSTGPQSIDPKTNKPYALDFPIITIKDMVMAEYMLLKKLGIKELFSLSGGSMGGMQVLEWIATYPDMVKSAIPIATAMKHSPQQIAFDEVGRQAVMADSNWKNGNYYEHERPLRGLAVARMVGHITYMSDKSMELKFSRKLKEAKYNFSFNKTDFEVEGYLRYTSDTFVKRFDANSYLYITKAMDYFDVSANKLIPLGKTIDTKFLVIAFKSDWLYPAYQSEEIVKTLKRNGVYATYCEIESSYGHDAFLLEVDEQTHLIKHFLKGIKDEDKK